MLRLLTAAFGLACFVLPAFAQDACPMTVADFLEQTAAPPAAVVADDVKVKASTFDEAIIVQYHGHEFIRFAKASCMVAGPLLLGALPDAAPATPPKPRLQGSGLEIGA